MNNISLAETSNAQMVAQRKHSFKRTIRRSANKITKTVKKCVKKAWKILKKMYNVIDNIFGIIGFIVTVYGIYEAISNAVSIMDFIQKLLSVF